MKIKRNIHCSQTKLLFRHFFGKRTEIKNWMWFSCGYDQILSWLIIQMTWDLQEEVFLASQSISHANGETIWLLILWFQIETCRHFLMSEKTKQTVKYPQNTRIVFQNYVHINLDLTSDRICKLKYIWLNRVVA